VPPFSSPPAIRAPHRRWACPTDFSVTASPVSCPSCPLISAHCGAHLLAMSPRDTHSPHRRCTRRAEFPVCPRHLVPHWRWTFSADFPVATCHPVATPPVCSHRRLSCRRMPSAGRANSVHTTPTLRSPRSVRSQRRRCASAADYPFTTCNQLATT
jgi:hypothetical protein